MEFLELYYQSSFVVKAVIVMLLVLQFLVISIFIVKFIQLFLIYFKLKKDKKIILNAKTISDINLDDKSIISAFVKDILDEINLSANKNQALIDRVNLRLESKASYFIQGLKYGTNLLASFGALTPFVGLFGTVWGIMGSFESIKNANNTSLEYIAPHISEALFATALGLFVAIPSVFLYNFFSKKIISISTELELILNHLIVIISRDINETK